MNRIFCLKQTTFLMHMLRLESSYHLVCEKETSLCCLPQPFLISHTQTRDTKRKPPLQNAGIHITVMFVVVLFLGFHSSSNFFLNLMGLILDLDSSEVERMHVKRRNTLIQLPVYLKNSPNLMSGRRKGSLRRLEERGTMRALEVE